MTFRRPLAAALAALALVSVVAGCSSDDSSSGAKKKTTSSAPTTTVPAPPTTVTDAQFETAAASSEALITTAGSDACKLLATFSDASSLPSPANPTQTERGVQVVVKLFEAAAATAPAASAADAATLRTAAANLQTEGAAKAWDPTWLTGQPGPAAISDPTVATAFRNYQTEVGKTCAPPAGAPTSTP